MEFGVTLTVGERETPAFNRRHRDQPVHAAPNFCFFDLIMFDIAAAPEPGPACAWRVNRAFSNSSRTHAC